MGIYERDYERGYDTGSGWRDGYSGGGSGGGFASWSANSKLLAVMVGVFILQNLTSDGAPRPASWLAEWFVLPADWITQPWRAYGLVTYSLLHSLQSVSHLLFNGIAIFFFGRTIEQRVGSREYLIFFFAAAAFAGAAWSLTEVALSPGLLQAPDDRVPKLLGASGGIAGIVVLFALWYPNVKVFLMGVLPVPAWAMAALFIGQDVLGALGRSGNVAYTAHLGGALFGYLYYRYGWRLSSWMPFAGGFSPADLFRRKPKLRVHRLSDDEHDEAVNPGDERVDEILRKIQASGQDSLTREERRILERASRRYKNRRQ